MGRRSALLDGHGDDFAWSLFDAAPDPVLVVSDTGEIAFANDQAAVVFGGAIEDLVGLGVDELVPADLRARHRADRTRYRARPEVRRMGAGLQLLALRRDGTTFDVEISLSPLPLGGATFVVAVVRDIGDRVAAEDHLHRVLATLDASEDGIFLFDADTLTYAHVNAGAERLVGYDAAELTTMSPVHLNPYRTEAEYRALVDRLLADPSTTITRETVLLRKDGREVPVEKTYRAGPTARDGSRWIVGVARDITARLAAEEELLASRDRLRQAEQAVAVAEDRDRIARDLHDTVIQRLFAAGLGLQAVAAMSSEPRVQSRLESTVDDLDTTIKELRSAIFSLQAPSAGPGGVRGRLLDVTSEGAAASGVEPRVTFDGPVESLPERVVDQLIPTLREALSNVVHHAHASSVRVGVSVADDQLELTVVDDGVGMADEVLGGHGLANMARRAEKLGGTMSVEPVPAGGTSLRWVASLAEG